jgi:hypothetical protein
MSETMHGLTKLAFEAIALHLDREYVNFVTRLENWYAEGKPFNSEVRSRKVRGHTFPTLWT